MHLCTVCRRIVGPEDTTKINPACGKPYGGQLLKWSWASSAFKPVAGISAYGYRLAIMPETGMPWIVDGCGQLRGWSASKKNLLGPNPKTTTYFDISAAGGKGEFLIWAGSAVTSDTGKC